MPDRDKLDDSLQLPFIFVPNGAPDPVAWRARHPDWFSVPARMTLPPLPGRGARLVRDIVQEPTSRSAAPGETSRIPRPNPPHIDRFFDELHDPLVEAARRLGISPIWLMGLGAYESGWLDEHNTRLNNPFG